jgi:hypothetical protein
LNTLIDFLYDTSADIAYHNTADVPLKDGKPTRSWMKHWTQEERTTKFFEFCNAYDKREDTLLAENYQQFSHRLHWHECPFVDRVAEYKDPFKVLLACIIFSFTNEHWQTFLTWENEGAQGMRDRFEKERHARSDLFQIYYPKGTDVKDWLTFGPERAAESLYTVLGAKNRPYSMMEFAKILNKYFVEEQGFRNAMYPCKNAARHVAMSHPEWVDPESFLHGGTGFFDGLVQIFDCDHFMSKAKYDIDENGSYVPLNKSGVQLVEYMDYLALHPDNPMHTQKYLNIEDKACFFYKHIAIRHGVKQTTKQVPYNWIYPDNWSLKTGLYNA